MNPKRGYYSLIQYCPNPGRLEAVNLGVLLFCSEAGFLEAKIGSNNDRVRRFFGGQSFDNWALTRAKQALVARLHLDREHLLKHEELERFIQTRGNEIILSSFNWLKRGGTTAAERFFGKKPANLFDWLLARLPLPARPARQRPQAA